MLVKGKPLVATIMAGLLLVSVLGVTNVGVADAQDVDHLFKKCKDRFDKGKYEDAIFYCNRVLEINPNDPDALFLKGAALFVLGEYEEAISYFDMMLEINPNDPDVLGFKCVALTMLGKYEEAIPYFDKVLEISPGDVTALKGKGLALLFLGKYAESISYFDNVLEINPNDPDALFLKASALAANIRTTDNGGRVFSFGVPNTARYDDKSPSIGDVITMPGSLKIFAKINDNVGVKDANIIVGQTALPMKLYEPSPNWWMGVIPSSDLPDPGNAVFFKVVARDYNNNIGQYSGWAEVTCAASGEHEACTIG